MKNTIGKNKPPAVVELVGPAGAGKTTLAKALVRSSPGMVPGIRPRYREIKYFPFFVKNALRMSPTLAQSIMYKNGRQLNQHEIARMVILSGWGNELDKMSFKQDGAVILDQGPLYLMANLYFFGPDKLRGTKLKGWWDGVYSKWANTLDVIFWLDAPDEILIERIHNRKKGHSMKGKDDQQIIQFLAAYRHAYERVIHAITQNNSPPQIIRFDTSLATRDEILEKIRIDLNSMIRIPSPVWSGSAGFCDREEAV